MAIQLSKLRGAYVVTTCSSKSFPHVKVRGHSPLVRYSRPLWSCVARALQPTYCNVLLNADACTHLRALLLNDWHGALVGLIQMLMLPMQPSS